MHERNRHRLYRALLLVVAGHLVFVVARVPHAAWSKRLGLIEDWRRLGPIGYHVGRTWPEAARVLAWLAANTPPDAAILFRGHWKGTLEFVPALLWPRLLWAAEAVPPDATSVHGHPLARGSIPGQGEGVLVLVGDGPRLEVVVR